MQIMTGKTSIAIGIRIRQYRLKAGLSQAGLAEKAGIKPNTVARLERGEHRASSETIEKLSKALEVISSDISGY
jgi:transcriptional regulator with XRE-family HTH domain